jgi:hypothetical protein
MGTEAEILANKVALNRTTHRWPYEYDLCEDNFLSWTRFAQLSKTF